MDKTPLELPPDSGLTCLAMLARLHGVAADPLLLRHRFLSADGTSGPVELLRAARSLGLRAGLRESDAATLDQLPLPLIAECRDGVWRILARVAEDRVLLHAGDAAQPGICGRDAFLGLWTGRVVLVAARRALAGAERVGMGWLFGALRAHQRVLAEVLAASVVILLLGLTMPLFFQVVVDKVLAHHAIDTLRIIVLGLLTATIFEVLLTGLRGWLLAHTAQRLDVVLGARLFAHLLRLPLGWFEARRSGDVVARIRELETLRAFLTGAALGLVLDLGFTFVAFLLMYTYSPALTGVVALSLPAYLLLAVLVGPLLRSQLDRRFRCGAENQSLLVEVTTGVRTLKSMALEPAMQRRWENQLADYASAAYAAANTANWAAQGATLLNRLVAVALLGLGAGAVMRGELTVGQLVAFNLFAARTGAPVLRIFQMWQEFQQARIAARRLADILQSPREGSGAANGALPALRGELRFERVSFRYAPERAHALVDIDLHVRPGEVLGVVGRSGSGKSTLARLLQRLHTPERGRVLMDGIDTALVEPDSLRSQIGVVPQECFLFNASVRENIALGDPGIPLERVVRAAQLAGAHEFIVALPHGYDTPLGEQACLLSGGQRQRIAIARALLREPRVLVFDEATSALDPESEAAVAGNIDAICAGRTVLIIAHRISALASCSRIVVLDDGRLVEDGAPAELLALGGHFARLHALQRAA